MNAPLSHHAVAACYRRIDRVINAVTTHCLRARPARHADRNAERPVNTHKQSIRTVRIQLNSAPNYGRIQLYNTSS